jgi:phosphoglycolate phosphatase-like HAD superfamily hydrolase
LVIRVGVFDFDGTLVDSNAVKMEGFFRLAARYPGGEAAMAKAIETSGDRRSILSAFSASMASSAVRVDVDQLVARYCEHVDPAVAAAPEMQGATDLLVSLRHAGLRLYLSSATPTESLLAILDMRGWTFLFNGIHGAPNSKIEALHKISEAEHASGEEIAVVGDGVDDAHAAKLFGAQFIAVGSGSYAAANPNVPTPPLHKVSARLLALRPLPALKVDGESAPL